MKYRLIQKYPGSPEIGYITQFDSDGEDWHTPNMLILEDCTKFPEYWQKVVEKDYEILSLRSINGKTIINYENGGGGYKKDYLQSVYKSKDKWIESFLNSQLWLIHSIKRLSDGEIFTIGDFAKYLPKYGGQEIKSFYLDRLNRLVVKLTGNEYLLTSIIKHKQPLFKTEDGVDIFDENTLLWDISTQNWDYLDTTEAKYFIDWKLNNIAKYRLAFSTKQAAEEYVIMNKPCLSINDVAKIYTTANHTNSFYPQTEKIRNKLKQI